MSAVTTRRSSSTCIFEDLERKEEVQEVGTALGIISNSPLKSQINSYKNPETSSEFEDTTLAESSAVSTVSIGEMCKICHCGVEAGASLIAPCYCSGSLKYVHQECLQRWIKSSDIKRCELCKYPFAMQAKVKPFCQWEKLDMTALERRKLFCSVTFHIVAITCVIWSLYVLIDRTYQEIRDGEPLQWPFWTKLIVVAIGFTGGLVFMYIQCKVYVHLCKKWKAYNRIIVVQDAPEGVHKPADGQLNKSSHSSVLPDISSSRRSSSAPLHHHYRTNNEVANSSGSPALTGTSNAVSTRGNSSGNSGGGGVATFTVTTEKTNAETQTALRGVAILENTECQAKAEGANCNESNRDHNTVFFTECECKRKGSSQAPKTSLPTSSSKKPKHSTSTPNISMQTTMSSTSASRISRKEQLTKKSSMTSSSSTVKTSENNRPPPVNRNHSFSPSSRRRRSELPGSPDDQPPERLRPKRRNTVVSPIHVIHKKI